MKKLFFYSAALLATSFATLTTSCSNDDDTLDPSKTMLELRWIEGNYTGKYEQSTKIYHGTSTTPATDYFSKQSCKVKVTLNPDTTLTVLIRGEYNSTMENEKITISEDCNTIKCDRYTFSKEGQSMRYYNSDNRSFNSGQSYQQAYVLFEAYKDFE